jgi:hypothetical protein
MMTFVYPLCYFFLLQGQHMSKNDSMEVDSKRHAKYHDLALFVHQLIEAGMGEGTLGLECNCVWVMVGYYFLY